MTRNAKTGFRRLGQPDVCVVCRRGLAAKVSAWWDGSAKTVQCVTCVASSNSNVVLPPLTRGVAGESVTLMRDRRLESEQQQTRDALGKLGRLGRLDFLVRIRPTGDKVKRAAKGEKGELIVGSKLDRLSSEQLVVLHDRRWPGKSTANIDHVVVTKAGVFIIDAKNFSEVKQQPTRSNSAYATARAQQKARRQEERKTVRATNGVETQVRSVQIALGDLASHVPVHGVACLAGRLGRWRGRSMRGYVTVCRPRHLGRVFSSEPDRSFDLDRVAMIVSAVLPPAVNPNRPNKVDKSGLNPLFTVNVDAHWTSANVQRSILRRHVDRSRHVDGGVIGGRRVGK